MFKKLTTTLNNLVYFFKYLHLIKENTYLKQLSCDTLLVTKVYKIYKSINFDVVSTSNLV